MGRKETWRETLILIETVREIRWVDGSMCEHEFVQVYFEQKCWRTCLVACAHFTGVKPLLNDNCCILSSHINTQMLFVVGLQAVF